MLTNRALLGLPFVALPIGLALLLVQPPIKAKAAESPWVAATNSKVRLFAGGAASGGGTILAGVQIRLDDGWKTYWRTPGDSGVPPRFDWSGSSNLKQAEVLYPAPHRFADAGGTAFGYQDEVVFPVKLTPEREGEPILLKLTVEFGLCKSLCIPNTADVSLTIAPGAAPDSADTQLLDSFLDRVPKPMEAGKLPALSNVEARFDGPKPELLIDAVFPEGAAGSDLFIEAPGDVYVPPPKSLGPIEGGKQRFAVSFASPEEVSEIKGKTLTFTLVYDGGARETTWPAK